VRVHVHACVCVCQCVMYCTVLCISFDGWCVAGGVAVYDTVCVAGCVAVCGAGCVARWRRLRVVSVAVWVAV